MPEHRSRFHDPFAANGLERTHRDGFLPCPRVEAYRRENRDRELDNQSSTFDITETIIRRVAT